MIIKNHVALFPISIEDANFEKCKNVVNKGKVINTSELNKTHIENMLYYSDFINTTLKKY